MQNRSPGGFSGTPGSAARRPSPLALGHSSLLNLVRRRRRRPAPHEHVAPPAAFALLHPRPRSPCPLPPPQPLYSPGGAATPQLFTQRKSLFCSDASPDGAGAKPAAANDRVKVGGSRSTAERALSVGNQ